MRLRVLVQKLASVSSHWRRATCYYREPTRASELATRDGNYCAPKFPSFSTRLPFHSHSARVWFLGGLVFCRIAVTVVVVCVEPRGPVISIGILGIQMTAVMRREFGTTEPPSSEVELGRGRANGLVHVHFLPPVGRGPWAALFLTKTYKRPRSGVCFFLSKVMLK